MYSDPDTRQFNRFNVTAIDRINNCARVKIDPISQEEISRSPSTSTVYVLKGFNLDRQEWEPLHTFCPDLDFVVRNIKEYKGSGYNITIDTDSVNPEGFSISTWDDPGTMVGDYPIDYGIKTSISRELTLEEKIELAQKINQRIKRLKDHESREERKQRKLAESTYQI